MKKLIRKLGIVIGSIFGIILAIGLLIIQTLHNPHICLNIAESFIKTEKLDLAELFTKKGIKVNSIKNLQKVHSNLTMVGLEQQLNMEYGHLYSQYSWIKYKRKDLYEAEYLIQEAIQYKKLSFQLNPSDLIRSGIINYEVGNKQFGWDNILQALLEDANIENTDPTTKAAIRRIVNEQVDTKVDVDDYLAKIRYENAEMVPNLSIIISDTIQMSLHDFIGNNFMVVFFNPGCGSCRQELKNISHLFQQDDAPFQHVFILNQPQTIKQAYQLLRRYDYKNPKLAILNNLNAYDLIHSEPTTWIVNKQGKIIYKHVGYQKGDDETYWNEIIEIEK